tara:strand:+ start:336 stop:569 length:234 start_codon:yes stop_codon:yes gene_type:complete
MPVEKLDIRNIIEIEQIKKLLVPHADLGVLFELVCLLCNERLNNEKVEKNIQEILEENIEPDLSDHSSDEEDDATPV